jgi:beta-lactamase regulating signal transducer with metallopeptidase domain
MTTFFPPTTLGFFLFALCTSAIVFLAAWAATYFLRSPDARHRVWVLSFATAGLWLGLGLLRWEVSVPVLPPVKPAIKAQKPTADTTLAISTPNRPELAVPTPSTVPQTSAQNATAPLLQKTKAPSQWNILPTIWAAGALLSLLPLILGERHWRRLRRGCKPVGEPRILRIFDTLCDAMKLRSRPRLFFSPDISSPILGSPLNPLLVLPAEAATWTDHECEIALHHELAHFQRRDLPALLFATAVTTFIWFQPLAWVARRRLRQEAEMAADDIVVGAQSSPVAYAEMLVNLCRRWKERPVHTGLGAAPSSLGLRLNRILDTSVERKPFSWRKRNAIGAGILAAALLMILLKPVAANNAPPLLQEIAKKNQAAFAKVSSLSFVELDTILGEDSSRFQMEWREEGSKSRYRFREFDDVGNIQFGVSYSYDGQVARRVHFGEKGRGSVLNRSTKPRDFDDWLIYRTFITTPWDFLALTDNKALRRVPPLLLIKDQANWQRFLEDAEILGRENYQGRECVAVKVKNRYLRNSVSAEDLGEYIVYFDPSRDFRPAGWKTYRPDGTLFQELIVPREETVRSDDGTEIVLPREIRTIYRSITWITAFADVTINSPDSFRFSLDETLAKQIYDEDTKKWSDAPLQPFLSVVLPDIEFADLPMNEVIRLLCGKAKESNPGQGEFSVSYTLASGKELPRFSMKLKQPTVGAVLAEMQKQLKGLQYETFPKALNFRMPQE